MGEEVRDALLGSASSALENSELCFREERYDATLREAILAIENAANAFITSLGGAYVSSHYEYRSAMRVVVQRRWRDVLRRSAFEKMLKIADLTSSSVNYRYPISVSGGEISVRKAPTREEAKEFLEAARYFLKKTTSYIDEYGRRRADDVF